LLQAAIASLSPRQTGGTPRRLCAGRFSKTCPRHFDALGGNCSAGFRIGLPAIEQAERILARAVSVHAAGQRKRTPTSDWRCSILKRYDDARKCQERAVALKPNFPTAWTNLGNALMRLGLPEHAVAAQRPGHPTQAPTTATPIATAAWPCCCSIGTIRPIRVSIALFHFSGRHLQATVGKGLVSLNLRHCDAAQTAFNAALAIRPDAARKFWPNRGRLYLEMGQLARAEADF